MGANNNSIANCYAIGNANGTGDKIGALVGANRGIVANCYARGNAAGGNESLYIGGLCGYNYRGRISNCYSIGSATGGHYAMYLGVLCGYNYMGDISDSFWDIQTSGMTVGYNLDSDDAGVIANVFGKTTFEMQYIGTFTDTGWDFVAESANGMDNVWIMPDGRYSILKGQVFADGDGTLENPYQISTSEGLEAVSNDLSANYILINDIRLSGEIYNQSLIASDTSTDSGFQGTAFTGLFYGNGFEIRNLTINGGVNDFVGLFGCIGAGGEVKDLALIDCDITGNYDIGAFAGLNYYGSISNSCSTGVITGLGNVGGLVRWRISGL